MNAPFTESSFKWAGAGMISSAVDLIKFGNIILYSYQKNNSKPGLPGYLKQETVQLMWTPVENTTVSWRKDGRYGMGWQVIQSDNGRTVKYAGHTGSTIGASCALIICPTPENSGHLPSGVVVAILGNMQGMPLGNVATQIADNFVKQ